MRNYGTFYVFLSFLAALGDATAFFADCGNNGRTHVTLRHTPALYANLRRRIEFHSQLDSTSRRDSEAPTDLGAIIYGHTL